MFLLFLKSSLCSQRWRGSHNKTEDLPTCFAMPVKSSHWFTGIGSITHTALPRMLVTYCLFVGGGHKSYFGRSCSILFWNYSNRQYMFRLALVTLLVISSSDHKNCYSAPDLKICIWLWMWLACQACQIWELTSKTTCIRQYFLLTHKWMWPVHFHMSVDVHFFRMWKWLFLHFPP